MDEIARLQIEIEHAEKRLKRISAAPLLGDADRRHAGILREAIARKAEKLARLQQWLSPRRLAG